MKQLFITSLCILALISCNHKPETRVKFDLIREQIETGSKEAFLLVTALPLQNGYATKTNRVSRRESKKLDKKL